MLKYIPNPQPRRTLKAKATRLEINAITISAAMQSSV